MSDAEDQAGPQRRWSRLGITVAAGYACFVAALVWQSTQQPSPFLPTETSTQREAIREDLGVLERATIAYARRVGRLPRSLGELVPGELAAVPRDPHGREYVLRSGGADKVFLCSLGADGELNRYPPDVLAIVTMDEVREAR